IPDLEHFLDQRVDVDRLLVPRRAPANGAVVKVLPGLVGIGERGPGLDAGGGFRAQVGKMHAVEALQAVEHRLLLGRGPIKRHFRQRHDRHQRTSRARLPLAIFEVTTAARPMSDRKIWMRAMFCLALGMSTFSNRFTRWVMWRTATCSLATR